MITAPQEQRYLQEDLSTFMVTSRYILLRMRIFGTKLVDKNQNTHVLCSVTFFEIAVCEVMWKKYCRARQATDGNIIWTGHRWQHNMDRPQMAT